MTNYFSLIRTSTNLMLLTFKEHNTFKAFLFVSAIRPSLRPIFQANIFGRYFQVNILKPNLKTEQIFRPTVIGEIQVNIFRSNFKATILRRNFRSTFQTEFLRPNLQAIILSRHFQVEFLKPNLQANTLRQYFKSTF